MLRKKLYANILRYFEIMKKCKQGTFFSGNGILPKYTVLFAKKCITREKKSKTKISLIKRSRKEDF